jgi:hypothetical protein
MRYILYPYINKKTDAIKAPVFYSRFLLSEDKVVNYIEPAKEHMN